MNILIPMAGEGSRFSKEGYTFPKPLIDVYGKPMIQCVVENLDFDAHYIFLVRKDHLQKYEMKSLLNVITNGNASIVEVDQLTEGAACTALLAREHIDNDEELLIANSDQVVEYRKENFIMMTKMTCLDGVIFSFNAVHPKWSFAKVNSRGYITQVAEKNPISDIATCGIYWYRCGSDFVKCADQMIENNERVNGEFYVAPAYNEMIKEGKMIAPFYVHKMHGLGTPEDLRKYLKILE